MANLRKSLVPILITALVIMGHSTLAVAMGPTFTAKNPAVTCTVSEFKYQLSPTQNSYRFKGRCQLQDTVEVGFTAGGVFKKAEKRCLESIEASARKANCVYSNASADPWLFNVVPPRTSAHGTLLDCGRYDRCLMGNGPFTPGMISAETKQRIIDQLHGPKKPPTILFPQPNQTYHNPKGVVLAFLMDKSIPSPTRWTAYGYIEKDDDEKGWKGYGKFPFFIELINGQYIAKKTMALPGGKYRIKAQAIHGERHKAVIDKEIWETPYGEWVYFQVPKTLAKVTAGTPTLPKLSVQSPNGGEVWRRGKTRYIKWSTFGLAGRVSVVLRKGGEFYKRLSPAGGHSAELGKMRWTPDGEIALGTDYTIRIRSKEDNSIMAESKETFSILPSFPVRRTGQQYGASMQTPSIKPKALLPAIKTAPMLKTKLNGKAFFKPAKITPSVKFAAGDNLAYFEVQKSTGPGKWATAKIYKTSKFTISQPGTYRYRAVGKGGGKGAWDTFKVKARPRGVRNL